MISNVPQRKATDCAIASLASAASVTWEAALEACFPGVDVATLDYYGRDAEAWLAGAKRLGVKVKGTSTYGAPKPQFSHGMMRTGYDLQSKRRRGIVPVPYSARSRFAHARLVRILSSQLG